MKTFEFEPDKFSDMFRLVDNPAVGFCMASTPFIIPKNAKRVWVEVRKSHARGCLRAQFMKRHRRAFYDIQIGKNSHLLTWWLSQFARRSKLFKLNEPFYFCMYYEQESP